MNGINLSTISGLFLNGNEYTNLYYGSTLIWTKILPYERRYFTTIAKGTGDITFKMLSTVDTSMYTSISYSTDEGNTWTTVRNFSSQTISATVSVNDGDIVLWKGEGKTLNTTNNTNVITSTVNFDVEGNVMSLFNGSNFYGSSFDTNYTLQCAALFYHNKYVNDASNLVLPSTTLTNGCYRSMFDSCTNLTSSPSILPATTLAESCYRSMFYNCSSLTTVPELPATTLAPYCYYYMFNSCISLTAVHTILPATTLANNCYQNMYRGCTGITTAPELPATILLSSCYEYMFYGCTNLNYIKMLATDISASNCLRSWVRNVAATGTFVKDDNMTTLPTGNNGIPTGWTIVNNSESKYFTTVAKGTGDITFTMAADVGTDYYTSISYSTDNGSTWTTTNNVSLQAVTVTVPVSNGDKVLWKGIGKTLNGTNTNNIISSTVNFDVEGNIMSLLNGDNFINSSFNTNYHRQFKGLFVLNTYLIDASNLILPATTLTDYCYMQMFDRCTNLTAAPTLPATTLAPYCYMGMFRSCDGMISVPKLPATQLAEGCYSYMFDKCTNLTAAPALPATTLADGCYSNMFWRCTSLITAPALPATTLASYCYNSMFMECTSLTSAPALPATTLTEECYQNMFSDCTSLTTAPALPATTLARYCYQNMFGDCTSLTIAPELLAPILAPYCYDAMFYNCRNLNYIKMLATDISAWSCLYDWVKGVSSTGTFVKDTNTTIPTGYDGIPYGWTVQNYNDYESKYFTTVAKGSGDITFNIPNNVSTSYFTSISYSTDNGATWTTTNNVDGQAVNVTVPVSNGDKVLWKGDGVSTGSGSYVYSRFSSNTNYDVEGNIMSLLNGDNFYHSGFTTGSSYNFYSLFLNNTTRIINAQNLVLPATTLTNNCYSSMFERCTALTTAPALPATTLAIGCYGNMFDRCSLLTTAPALPATTLTLYCYSYMFRGCSALTTAPALPATTLVDGCYSNMFRDCSALTTAPALPATTLADYCYSNMFNSCTSLTTAPDLLATTLLSSCYENMFQNCSNLNYIKMLANDNLTATACLGNWVDGVSATGTFTKDANATIPTGSDGIPEGWTVINQ